jgi:C-terminal processing protease CtpA/Prc
MQEPFSPHAERSLVEKSKPFYLTPPEDTRNSSNLEGQNIPERDRSLPSTMNDYSTVEFFLSKDQLKGMPGMVLSSDNAASSLIVDTIREGGWFSGTGLTPGMVILAINEVSMYGKRPIYVMQALRHAQKFGRLFLLAGMPKQYNLESDTPIYGPRTLLLRQTAIERCSRVQSILYKESKEANDGIEFIRQGKNTPLIIKSIDQDGLLGSSILSSGMIVLKINGKDSTWLHPKDAVKLIRNAPIGKLSLVAEGFYGKAHRKKRGCAIGLDLRMNKDFEGIFIADIKKDSDFASSHLRAGLQIILVNGKPCPLNLRDASNLLSEIVGDIEILGTASYREGNEFTLNDLSKCQSQRLTESKATLSVNRNKKVDDSRPQKKASNSKTTTSVPPKIVPSIIPLVQRKGRRKHITDLNPCAGKLFERHLAESVEVFSLQKLPKASKSIGAIKVILQKELSRAKPGVVFSRHGTPSRFIVKELREGGWFFGSSLQQGMEIVSIDGISMIGKELGDIFRLFREAKSKGQMEMIAKRNNVIESNNVSRTKASASSIAFKKSEAVLE